MDMMTKIQQKQSNRRLAVAGWIYFNAILVMVLGLVHCGAAVLIMQKPAVTMLPAEWERVFLYMYLATGVAVFCAGWLVHLAVPGLRRKEAWGWDLAVRTSAMLVVFGLGAAVAMWENPFAHLMLLFSLALLIPLLWYRRAFDPRRHAEPTRI